MGQKFRKMLGISCFRRFGKYNSIQKQKGGYLTRGNVGHQVWQEKVGKRLGISFWEGCGNTGYCCHWFTNKIYVPVYRPSVYNPHGGVLLLPKASICLSGCLISVVQASILYLYEASLWLCTDTGGSRCAMWRKYGSVQQNYGPLCSCLLSGSSFHRQLFLYVG